MAKIDDLFSLMDPADHAVYTPHLTAVSCKDRDYLVRLNAEIFDIDLEEASGFVNSSLDDDRCRPSELIDCFSVPWFKHDDRVWIDRFAAAFRKVIDNHEQLLEQETQSNRGGRWYGTENA